MENQSLLTGLENQSEFLQASTAPMPTSFGVLIFESQIGKIYLHYLLGMLLLTTVSDDDLPIALHKGKHTYTSHLISHFISNLHLSSSFYVFISFMDSFSIPKSVSEALFISGWKDAMKEEMLSLEQNNTSDFAALLSRRKKLDVGGYTL